MSHKITIALTTAAMLAACSAETNEPAAKPVTAANAPKATARLQIQGAAAPAPAPFSLQALAANGVTIETASITVDEINFKGWEYDDEVNDHDENEVESEDESNEDSEDEVRTAAEDVEDGAGDETEGEDDADDGAAAEADEIEDVDFKGPFVVDLLTGISTPALGETVMPSGQYSEIEFKLDSAEDESRGSLEVAGQLDVDGVWHPFVLRNLRDEELKWKFTAPVAVTAREVNDLVLNMPLQQWVNDALVAAMADMVRSGDAVTDGTTGAYVFTSDSGDVADLLEANFENEGEVEHDDEGEDAH